MGAEVLTVKISSVQAVALAFVTYFIGLWIKNRVPVFQKAQLTGCGNRWSAVCLHFIRITCIRNFTSRF